MSFIRNALVATALIAASAAPAFAQGGGGGNGERESSRYMYVAPDGAMSYLAANAKATTLLMKYAKPVTAGTIFFRNSGTLYMVQDQKMSNGVMLFRAMRDSDSNS